jgi:hypothetical protein
MLVNKIRICALLAEFSNWIVLYYSKNYIGQTERHLIRKYKERKKIVTHLCRQLPYRIYNHLNVYKADNTVASTSTETMDFI